MHAILTLNFCTLFFYLIVSLLSNQTLQSPEDSHHKMMKKTWFKWMNSFKQNRFLLLFQSLNVFDHNGSQYCNCFFFKERIAIVDRIK